MDAIESLQNALPTYVNVFIAVFRYVAPILALLILWRAAGPLLRFRREPEIWAWLHMGEDRKVAITHWENVIGRDKNSDVVIDLATVSRSHAVLTRYDDGSWSISDADNSGGVLVNGKKVTVRALKKNDVITIGGMDMTLEPISRQQEKHLAKIRTKASSYPASFANILLLSVFQVLICIGLLMTGAKEQAQSYLMGYGIILISQWALFLFYIFIRRPAFEVETIAFFLCSMGMAAICAVSPEDAVKQAISMALGIGVFLMVGWALRDLERAKKIRYLAAVGGIGFLLATLAFGETIDGAKNWIMIGGMSIQPSELSKLCFVFVGASTLDLIMTKRNLFLFIGYSLMVCGCLALMGDFGAALIFFCAFLVIAYMRSGSVGTVTLAITSLVFAGVVIVKFAPHALSRFANWRHIWEDPLVGGYQQTQALMRMASGGLVGLGINQGWRGSPHLPAPTSDAIIATLGEEWGLVMVVLLIFCIVALALFSVRCSKMGRSSFYTIGSCTASTILVVQVILNALGTVDVVPYTGVTFPFLSNGGSSMLCVWGLLGFIKAADTRQNASFAVRLLRKRGGEPNE